MLVLCVQRRGLQPLRHTILIHEEAGRLHFSAALFKRNRKLNGRPQGRAVDLGTRFVVLVCSIPARPRGNEEKNCEEVNQTTSFAL